MDFSYYRVALLKNFNSLPSVSTSRSACHGPSEWRAAPLGRGQCRGLGHHRGAHHFARGQHGDWRTWKLFTIEYIFKSLSYLLNMFHIPTFRDTELIICRNIRIITTIGIVIIFFLAGGVLLLQASFHSLD